MSDTSNRPSHKMFAILPRGGKDDKNYWVEVGAGWSNSDGSINFRQELFPRDPNVVIQVREIETDNG